MESLPRIFRKSIPILLGLGIIFLILLRIEVATQRFFDVDEYTHMHWAAEIFHGQKPYVNFFTFFPPGYHWMLQPLFVLFPKSPDIFIVGRMFGVLTFVGLLVVVTIFFARLRSIRFALLPAFILAFLPMPYDKYFEIRPDTMSTLLGFIGVLLLSMGWRVVASSKYKGVSKKNIYFLSAGIIFAICLLVLPKMLPFVMVVGAVALGDVFVKIFYKKHEILRAAEKDKLSLVLPILKPLLFLILGGGIVGLLFFFWMVSLGDFGTVWYSLTKLGVEGNQIGKYFIMEPHLFFFPNSSFYGGEGITLSFVVNHLIWMFAFVVGTFRFFTPFRSKENKKTTTLDEIVLGGIFFVSVFGYIYFFPLKHTQYLIPIGVFIAFYAADGLVSLFDMISFKGTLSPSIPHEKGREHKLPLAKGKAPSSPRYSVYDYFRLVQQGIPVFTVVVLIMLGIAVNRELNARKLWWKNTDQQKEYTLLQQTVPADATVLDLEGKMFDWNHGYYVCCLAFGQFGYLLSHPLPDVKESLIKNNVTYIYQGDSHRLGTVPPDGLSYINSYYAPVPGWGDKLLKRK